MPCGNFPLLLKKNNKNGKIVIINLQPTRMDKHADLVINYKLDYVFQLVLEELKFELEVANKVIPKSIYTSKENEHLLINTDNLICNLNEKHNCYKINAKPNLILIFTGKRKSGKDFSVFKLIEKLKKISLSEPNIETITLSAPLKLLYAQENNLNFEKLSDSSQYKEKYREDMIRFDYLIILNRANTIEYLKFKMGRRKTS